MECVPFLDEVDEAPGILCLQLATVGFAKGRNNIGEEGESAGEVPADEWYGVDLLQTITSKVHAAWANVVVHPFTTKPSLM